MLDSIASLAVIVLNRFLHFMPMGFNLWLGRLLSGIFYAFSGKRKNVTYANMRAAFCAEKTPEQIKVMARGAYTHATQTFAELISMTKVDAAYIDKYVSVRNFERLAEASKNPRGMLLISAHFGNWELSLVASAVRGYPLYILARDQKMKKLNELFNKLRESKGSVVVRKGADIKRLIKVLRQGKSVGLLADQNAGVNGQILELFGRLASTAVGPYRLAQKDGAVIIPAFIHRKKGPYHELFLEECISIKEDEDIVPYMEKYNRLLEKHIRQDPEQWFWMHKKWKMNPVRKIMVLDDGKKGHLKQSLAILEEIRKYRASEGNDPANIKAEIVKVEFAGEFRKKVFKAIAPLIGRNCQGSPRLLRWALDEPSCDRVLRNYADIILSAGSSLACVNMMLKDENYGRNAAVLDPGALIRGKFDVVVIPRHDIKGPRKEAKAKKDNIVVTEMAPNLICSGKDLGQDESRVQNRRGRGELNVGVLIGGDNKHFYFSEELIRQVLGGVSEICEKYDGRIHVTTSRRTPPDIEKAVSRILGASSRLETMVFGTEDKEPDTVEKILGVCQLVIVSSESVSMVSEAVSSGKRVIIFTPQKRNGKKTKYEKFAESLAAGGYASTARPGDLAAAASRMIENEWAPKDNEDGQRIREKLYRLF